MLGGRAALVTKHLEKRFGTMTAVDHITMAIDRKECFGLLGPNGAGMCVAFEWVGD